MQKQFPKLLALLALNLLVRCGPDHSSENPRHNDKKGERTTNAPKDVNHKLKDKKPYANSQNSDKTKFVEKKEKPTPTQDPQTTTVDRDAEDTRQLEVLEKKLNTLEEKPNHLDKEKLLKIKDAVIASFMSILAACDPSYSKEVPRQDEKKKEKTTDTSKEVKHKAKDKKPYANSENLDKIKPFKKKEDLIPTWESQTTSAEREVKDARKIEVLERQLNTLEKNPTHLDKEKLLKIKDAVIASFMTILAACGSDKESADFFEEKPKPEVKKKTEPIEKQEVKVEKRKVVKEKEVVEIPYMDTEEDLDLLTEEVSFEDALAIYTLNTSQSGFAPLTFDEPIKESEFFSDSVFTVSEPGRYRIKIDYTAGYIEGPESWNCALAVSHYSSISETTKDYDDSRDNVTTTGCRLEVDKTVDLLEGDEITFYGSAGFSGKAGPALPKFSATLSITKL